MMTGKTTRLAGAAAVLLATPALMGQSIVDRKVREIAIVPDGTGTCDVHVVWTAAVNDTGAGLNASTGVVLTRNDEFVGFEMTLLFTDFTDGLCGAGNCFGSCGAGFIDGVLNTMLCLPDPPECLLCPCECQFPWITTTFEDVPMLPDDTLTAEVVPAGGPAEEPGPNNVKTVRFDGDGRFWNPRLRSVDLDPTPTPGVFDVAVELDLVTKTDETAIIVVHVILVINGAAYAEFDLCGGDPWIISPDNACNNGGPCPDAQFCASSSCSGDAVHECEPFAAGEPGFPLPGCGCLSDPVLVAFPSVPLAPGDEVHVELVAPDGAGLPGLPGFEVDDEIDVPVPCIGDLDADGAIGLVDLLGLLAKWGPCDGCPEDLDGNGAVDLLDLLELLSKWGPCSA